MPKTRRRGLAQGGELPGTLKRSSKEAQETFTKARDSAVQAYGEGDQADRAAYAEFKRTFEKRGDHWIPKQPAGPEALEHVALLAIPGEQHLAEGQGAAVGSQGARTGMEPGRHSRHLSRMSGRAGRRQVQREHREVRKLGQGRRPGSAQTGAKARSTPGHSGGPRGDRP